MNREIKFRGKRKYGGSDLIGTWAYGDLIHHVYISNGQFGKASYICDNTTDGEEWGVDPETVGQYTGFKDKYDVEIYEGDIVKTDWGYEGIVSYDNFIYAMCECAISDDIEVIGNIYDNPELL